ncbi:MAG: biotin/lipoyl-containing protein [Bacteroidota bacterium]
MNTAIVEGQELLLKNLVQGFQVNGQTVQPDIERINEKLWQIQFAGKSYTLFVIKVDEENKQVQLSINGKRTTVQLRSRTDDLIKQLGLEDSMKKKLEVLKAPMPGLIHSIQVEEGASIQKGEPLLILEAMKMENVIKSPGDGIIAKILVEEKASVEKNELLIQFA